MLRFWVLTFAVATTPASAATIDLYNATLTADANAIAPLGNTPGLGDPNGGDGGGLLSGDILFTAPFGGPVAVTLTDLGTTASLTPRAGSVYQVILDGTPLGVTAAEAIDSSVFSSATFSLVLGAGDHDLGIWDFVSTYLGSTSPYGGTVDQDFSQADVAVDISEVVVPEPSSLPLLAAGLIGLCGLAWRRRSAGTAEHQAA
jgi:hypothetical protein